MGRLAQKSHCLCLTVDPSRMEQVLREKNSQRNNLVPIGSNRLNTNN